jgi:hypothetical protein
VVSLEAHTTRLSLTAAAAEKTLKFMAMLALKVTAGVLSPGAGMLARWTTAPVPASLRTSTAWP